MRLSRICKGFVAPQILVNSLSNAGIMGCFSVKFAAGALCTPATAGRRFAGDPRIECPEIIGFVSERSKVYEHNSGGRG